MLTKILTILGSKEGEDYRGEWSSPRGVKIFPISKIHAYLNSNFPMRLFLSGKKVFDLESPRGGVVLLWSRDRYKAKSENRSKSENYFDPPPRGLDAAERRRQ